MIAIGDQCIIKAYAAEEYFVSCTSNCENCTVQPCFSFGDILTDIKEMQSIYSWYNQKIAMLQISVEYTAAAKQSGTVEYGTEHFSHVLNGRGITEEIQ